MRRDRRSPGDHYSSSGVGTGVIRRGRSGGGFQSRGYRFLVVIGVCWAGRWRQRRPPTGAEVIGEGHTVPAGSRRARPVSTGNSRVADIESLTA
jgi:hypothetical protein